jgi:hypothetical protein
MSRPSNKEKAEAGKEFLNMVMEPEVTEIIESPPIDPIKNLDNGSSADMCDRGANNLIEWILKRAIYDYKALEAKGIVKNGKLVRKLKHKKEVVDYPTEQHVQNLLFWFKDRKEMQFWLDLAHIDFDSEAVCRGLGIPV